MEIRHQPSWSSPIESSSPSPPPPPPPVSIVDKRSQRISARCPQCRGRLASLPTRTTSLSSYSGCKDTKTLTVPPVDDEDSFSALCDQELNFLHRNIPALRRRDVDAAAINQHFYPEGGWGWLICGAAFLAHLLTSGIQLAFGLLHLYVVKFLNKKIISKDIYRMSPAWLGSLCLCVSLLTSPVIVIMCRRRSIRLVGTLGGLLTALACLFTSFAVQFHQVFLSYGLVLGIGSGIVRETAGLMLGHYFKKRRELVEMIAQAGTGVGIALFSVLYKEAIGKLGWRLGLQAVTGLLTVAFFLPVVYRSANLYHPQRRAITHLKNQRRNIKEKKTHKKSGKITLVDFTPLKSRVLKLLMLSSATSSLGLYAPVFSLVYQGYTDGLEEGVLVILQTFMGFASALGCVGIGLIIVKHKKTFLIPRQYICQVTLVGSGASILLLGTTKGYHGYVIFCWVYGTFLGSYTYSMKMFALERIRGKYFTKSWSFIQGANSFPILFGTPLAGYLNHLYPKSGYYFCFVTTVLGASLMFFVRTHKDHIVASTFTCSLNSCSSAKLSECACNPSYMRDPQPFLYFPQHNTQCEKLFTSNNHSDFFFNSSDLYHLHRRLPKSLSYAANINRNFLTHPVNFYDNRVTNYCSLNKNLLRPSKSDPEGLARQYLWFYRRPLIRNIQVIEQITTTV